MQGRRPTTEVTEDLAGLWQKRLTDELAGKPHIMPKRVLDPPVHQRIASVSRFSSQRREYYTPVLMCSTSRGQQSHGRRIRQENHLVGVRGKHHG